ncbi:hypothetical protein [Lutispora sp.]|uniref:hypothetical protein n=1 Tax=Lutispora sp. TaxID=2828727 RepID=UPI003563E4CF
MHNEKGSKYRREIEIPATADITIIIINKGCWYKGIDIKVIFEKIKEFNGFLKR